MKHGFILLASRRKRDTVQVLLQQSNLNFRKRRIGPHNFAPAIRIATQKDTAFIQELISTAMSDSTLIDVHEPTKEVIRVASPRSPRSQYVLETRHWDRDHSSQSSLGRWDELEETTDERRRRSFSLRSDDDIASLVSMASAASRSRGSRSNFDDDDDDDDDDDESTVYDSESTLSDEHSSSIASFDEEHDVNDAYDDDFDEENKNHLSLEFDIEACRLVQDSWRTLQGFDEEEDYRKVLGDTMLLCMMEVDPSSRNALGISSFRSPRYGKVCCLLGDGVEKLVNGLAQATPAETAAANQNLLRTARTVFREWERQGVNVRLLVQDALVYGIQSSLPPDVWTDQLDNAWHSTLVQLFHTLL